MKKLLSMLLALVLVMSLASCGEPKTVESQAPEDQAQEQPQAKDSRENADFRFGKWGESPETVKQFEPEEMVAGDGTYMIPEVQVAGHTAAASYFFDDSYGLYQGTYYFLDENYIDSNYIAQFDELKKSLSSVYGDPTFDDVIVNNQLADYTDEINALKMGYITYGAKWEEGSTEIILALAAENYSQLRIAIVYTDTRFEGVNTNGL